MKILVMDDSVDTANTLKDILTKEGHEVSVAINGMEALSMLRRSLPDVILLDVRLGAYDGIRIARDVHRRFPDCKVIILTTYDDDDYLYGALEAGAHAYLLKDVSLEELPTAIRQVHGGKRLLSPDLMDRVLAQFQSLAQEKAAEDLGVSLEDRQLLAYIADGLTNREIAQQLHYSEATVKKKVQELLEKLGVSNRTQAVAMAIRQGLI